MKKLTFALAAVLAITLGAGAALFTSLEPILVKTVNTYGPDITGTPVTLRDMDLSLFSGKGSLHGFTLGNPRGFSGDHALRVDKASVALDTSTLLKDVVVIDSIVVDSPDIVYELGAGKSNFDAILDNVAQLGEGRARAEARHGASSDAGEGPERKVVIDEFIVRGGKAALSIPALKLSASAELPEIRITGIGRDETGASAGTSMAEAAALVLRQLSTSLAASSDAAVRSVKVSIKAQADAVKTQLKDAEAQARAVRDAVKQGDIPVEQTRQLIESGLGALGGILGKKAE